MAGLIKEAKEFLYDSKKKKKKEKEKKKEREKDKKIKKIFMVQKKNNNIIDP